MMRHCNEDLAAQPVDQQHLVVGPKSPAADRQHQQETTELRHKKSVRFDESSNEEFHVEKNRHKDKANLWYNSIDFDRFADKVARRVEYICTAERKRKTLLILEEVHFACRGKQFPNGAEKEHPALGCHNKKEMLVKSYHDNDELCGLEPYLAEYMPEWIDRFDQHKDMLREVLKKDRRSKRPFFKRHKARTETLDQRSRRVSLGSRIFAREIAEATAASVAQSNRH